MDAENKKLVVSARAVGQKIHFSSILTDSMAIAATLGAFDSSPSPSHDLPSSDFGSSSSDFSSSFNGGSSGVGGGGSDW